MSWVRASRAPSALFHALIVCIFICSTAELRVSDDWTAWTVAEVGEWSRHVLVAFKFREAAVAAAVSTLNRHEIIGNVLPLLTLEDLVTMGLPLGVAKVLLYCITRLRRSVERPDAPCTILDVSDVSLCKRPGLSFLVPGEDVGSDSSSSSGTDAPAPVSVAVLRQQHRMESLIRSVQKAAQDGAPAETLQGTCFGA